MKTSRKSRADSVTATIKAMVSVAEPWPQPPSHVRLRDEDGPFWDGIIRARARDEWTKADLVVGAQLARTMRDIEVESEKLESEGSVIENQRGTPVMNPRHAVLEQLARREMALMRSLRMGGTSAGLTHDAQKSRQMQTQAERVREELQEDSLLAL